MPLRTETVTVRLDPRLRYLAELAARRQHATLSGFLEWAIRDALREVALGKGQDALPLQEEGDALWDADASTRRTRLAQRYPALLSYDEQVWWKWSKDQTI